MERHTHRLSLVFYLGGRTLRRCLNKIVILVVGFIGEVLACVGEDVSGDVHVDGVNPTRMCHWSFGVVRRNKEVCEGGTELIFLRGCCSSSRVIDWEPKGDDQWLCFLRRR